MIIFFHSTTTTPYIKATFLDTTWSSGADFLSSIWRCNTAFMYHVLSRNTCLQMYRDVRGQLLRIKKQHRKMYQFTEIYIIIIFSLGKWRYRHLLNELRTSSQNSLMLKKCSPPYKWGIRGSELLHQLPKSSQKFNGRARTLSPAPLLPKMCSEALPCSCSTKSGPDFLLLFLSASGQGCQNPVSRSWP